MKADSFWNGQRVLITGGAGFIGSHLVEGLVEIGADVRVADSFEAGDETNLSSVSDRIEVLRTNLLDYENCLAACSDVQVVMHLAAKVAGVGYNSTHSSEMFTNNLKIGMNMLEAARESDVERLLCVSSACVYSRETSVPTPEVEGFVNDPEPSNLGYGWAKRVLEVQSRLYACEYGMKISIVRPFNTYGPRDHFLSQDNHVIPSLITKVVKGENPLIVWGDGRQTRSFIYVSDVARGMIQAVERYPKADPVNIGSAEEVSIRDLVTLIVKIANKNVEVRFDQSKPQGQMRRCPEVTKAKNKIGFEATVKLKDGLRQTIEWFERNQPTARIETSVP